MWFYPPPPSLLPSQPPSVSRYFAQRLLLWMPRKMWQVKLHCPHPECEQHPLTSAGGYQRVRQVLDVDGYYILAAEYNNCSFRSWWHTSTPVMSGLCAYCGRGDLETAPPSSSANWRNNMKRHGWLSVPSTSQIASISQRPALGGLLPSPTPKTHHSELLSQSPIGCWRAIVRMSFPVSRRSRLRLHPSLEEFLKSTQQKRWVFFLRTTRPFLAVLTMISRKKFLYYQRKRYNIKTSFGSLLTCNFVIFTAFLISGFHWTRRCWWLWECYCFSRVPFSSWVLFILKKWTSQEVDWTLVEINTIRPKSSDILTSS